MSFNEISEKTVDLKVTAVREDPKKKILDSIVTKRGSGYISDVIGEEYRRWSSNDLILINAPTGSGKTTFVLHELLYYAISSGKKILYLVNRKVLVNQIRAELEDEVRDELYKCCGQRRNVNAYIDVVTYQSVEEKIKKGTQESLRKLDERFQEYSYVVYDECHYFDVDSTYNTSTQLSFDFLTECFSWKTQIYISATMDCIKERIVMTAYNIREKQIIENYRLMRLTEYIVDKKYDYINIHLFNDIDHLKTIILEDKQSSSSKWLIFVESIDDGRKLQNQLVEENDGRKITAEDVVFIDAKYEQDEDAVESVLELSEKKLISRKIIITTPVLDNGVSFRDIKLRNIVITADNKEEFIQMLGRKREDQQMVELFIQRRSKEFFERRYQSINSILRTYDKFENDFRCIYSDDVGMPTYWYSCMEEKKIQPKDQQNMLKYIMSNSVLCRHFTKFAFALGGFIALNSISIDRLMRLKVYYKEIVQRLAEDPDAFLKLQLNWLGKNEEEIVSIINDCKTKGFEDCVTEIKKMVIAKLNIIMDRQTNIVFRNEMEKECSRLIDICDKNIDATVKSRCKRVFRDRECPISAPVFNDLMEIANLPYIMKNERNQGYTISEK